MTEAALVQILGAALPKAVSEDALELHGSDNEVEDAVADAAADAVEIAVVSTQGMLLQKLFGSNLGRKYSVWNEHLQQLKATDD